MTKWKNEVKTIVQDVHIAIQRLWNCEVLNAICSSVLSSTLGLAFLCMMAKVRISQEAFDAVVRENVEEFGMDEEEAVADAIHTFQLQGVDLTGIITTGKSGTSSGEHPVIEAIRNLEAAVAQNADDGELEITKALDSLRLVCTEEGQENASIAARNGAVDKAVSACKLLLGRNVTSLATALKTLSPILNDDQSKRDFGSCGGPEVILNALLLEDSSGVVPELAGSVVASAASRDEIIKEEFMQLKVEEVLVRLIRKYAENAGALNGTCDALRALVTADDERVLASNAFRNARRVAKAGAIEAILEASRFARKETMLLATLCATLKAIAVNEEVCKSVAASGGIELVLQFIDESVKTANKSLAQNSCSLLAQLAGSDANKDEIVSQGGYQKLVTLALHYPDEVVVLQEVMSAIAYLSLRSPANASKAVEAGAIDLAAEMMESHPLAASMQKQACQMLRNLAVRNPENRPLILERGLENLIRATKSKHPSCKDAASAALRDLGLDNYN